MRFAAINPFVGAAERARLGFDPLYQPESHAALPPASVPADRAVHADAGQGLVE